MDVKIFSTGILLKWSDVAELALLEQAFIREKLGLAHKGDTTTAYMTDQGIYMGKTGQEVERVRNMA